MQPVRRLVGVDADERRPRAIDRAMEPLERHVRERLAERVAEPRVEPAPERQRAADHVLPEAALRLVQRRRAARRERRTVERRVAAVLVEPVSDLVHRREERVPVQVVLGVAGRQADVAGREREAEGVDRRVEPEVLVRGAERAGHLERELVLRVARVRPGDERLGLVVGRGRGELAKRRLEPLEHASHLVGVHARLEVVEEHVVRVVRRRKALDVALLQLQGSVEPRPEARVVVVRPGFGPRLHRLRAELRHLALQRGWHASRLLPVPARDRYEAGVVRVRVEIRDLGLETIEQLADLVAHEQLVGETMERREPLGAGLRSAAGHHHELVPLEDAGRDA